MIAIGKVFMNIDFQTNEVIPLLHRTLELPYEVMPFLSYQVSPYRY